MKYRPKYFELRELVGPAVHAKWGERAWQFLQAPALITLDQLRERFGRIIVNNWHAGGTYKESGLRDFETSTGAGMSQHKFGGAFDTKPRDTTPQAMHAYILAHPGEFPYLTTLEAIESTPTWLHFDVRNHGSDGILVVKP